MKKVITLCICLFYLQNTFSQGNILFYGKITSKSGFVFNVNIINKKLKRGTVSDLGGNFSLQVSNLDTLNFSCIGYKSFSYVIPDTIISNSFRVIISMAEDSIQIKEAIITPWPINKNELKEAFLKEKPEKEIISTYAGFREIDGPQKEPEPTILNPISFIAKIFSKKRIANVRMNRIRKKLQKR